MTEYRNNELVLIKVNLWEPGSIGRISCMMGKEAERTAVAIRLALWRNFREIALHPKNRRVRRKIVEKNQVVAEISEKSILIRYTGGHLRRIKLRGPIDISVVPAKGLGVEHV